jgi:hypothetical protein
MRILNVSAAVAAIIASGAAAAANVDIYVTGASAQRNFWRADVGTLANCSPVTYTWGGPASSFTDPTSGVNYTFGTPDFSFTTCTAGASPVAGSGINPGDTVTLHYSAELGSVNGISVALGKAGVAGYPTTHTFLSFNAADCNTTTHVCGSASSPKYALYTPNTGGACPQAGQDAFCGGNPAEIVTVAPDIVVADIEPSKFQNPDNWPSTNIDPSVGIYTALGAAPTADQLAKITGGTTMNGQVFAVITNGVPGSPANFSRASLQSIFQGAYTTWNQVPEVGAADSAKTPIVICRRDHGSGTQTAASLLFTGTECGLTNTFQFAAENTTGTVIINNTTGQLKTCVNAGAGRIGFLSVQGNLPGATGFTMPTIDGVAVNAHNAAAGYYPFAFETWAKNASGGALPGLLITRAKSAANLGSQLSTETVTESSTTHQFAVSSGNPIGYYALPVSGAGNPNTVAGLKVSPGVPTALKTVSGESCTVAAGSNGT